MRPSRLIVAMVALAALAGCGKPAADSGSAEATAPAAAPAAPPTEAEAKALVATLPAPYNSGDVVNGKAKFAMCRSCHTTEAGGSNMTGPNLHGVFGKPAAHHDAYKYSDALKASGLVWTPDRIDAWIANPRELVSGNKMGFVGLKDAKDRSDVIAYLKVATN